MKGVDRAFVNKIIIIALAALIVVNFRYCLDMFASLKKAFTPLFIGVVVALILSVPMDFFENKLFHKTGKFRSPLALACSLIIFFGAILGFGFLIIPKVNGSLQSVITSFSDGAFEEVMQSNKTLAFIFEQVKKYVSGALSRIEDFAPKMIEIAESVFNTIIDLFLGVFFGIMILSNKKELKRQTKKLLSRMVKQDKYKAITDVFEMAVGKFSRYIGGQIIEAMVLGVVCYIFMTIIGLPFAPLISLITAVVNLIPILGAYVGGFFSGLLILAVNPMQAVIFVIFIVCLQQLEAVTTYPVIVGRYVGLSGFWILAAVVIGGSLFGFAGVFLGVPVTAFLHEFVGGLLKKKKPKSVLVMK